LSNNLDHKRLRRCLPPIQEDSREKRADGTALRVYTLHWRGTEAYHIFKVDEQDQTIEQIESVAFDKRIQQIERISTDSVDAPGYAEMTCEENCWKISKNDLPNTENIYVFFTFPRFWLENHVKMGNNIVMQHVSSNLSHNSAFMGGICAWTTGTGLEHGLIEQFPPRFCIEWILAGKHKRWMIKRKVHRLSYRA
jgi:hypothetical protein